MKLLTTCGIFYILIWCFIAIEIIQSIKIIFYFFIQPDWKCGTNQKGNENNKWLIYYISAVEDKNIRKNNIQFLNKRKETTAYKTNATPATSKSL